MENSGMEKNVQSNDMGVVQKIIGIFASPGKTFESISNNPTWLVPFIITLVTGLIFVFLTTDIIIKDTLMQQEEALIERGVDADQMEQQLEMTEKFMGFSMPAFAVIMPLLSWLVVSGVFMLVGNVFLGGSTKFKKVWSVTAWSWLIHAIAGLVFLPLVLAKETILITFSPAAMMSDADRLTFMYQFLSKFDIFNIWFVAVLSIGLAVIYNMKTQKMVTAGFAVLVFYALGSAGWSAMF